MLSCMSVLLGILLFMRVRRTFSDLCINISFRTFIRLIMFFFDFCCRGPRHNLSEDSSMEAMLGGMDLTNHGEWDIA